MNRVSKCRLAVTSALFTFIVVTSQYPCTFLQPLVRLVEVHMIHPKRKSTPLGMLYCFISSTCFFIRLSALCSCTTMTAWIIPGRTNNKHKSTLINACTGLPTNSTATGGNRIANRYNIHISPFVLSISYDKWKEFTILFKR